MGDARCDIVLHECGRHEGRMGEQTDQCIDVPEHNVEHIGLFGLNVGCLSFELNIVGRHVIGIVLDERKDMSPSIPSCAD